jgi:hypothetical protein
MTLIDSYIEDTPVAVSMDRDTTSATPAAGSLILENVQLVNVGTAVQGTSGTVLAGSAATTIAAWGQGNSYTPTSHTTFQGPITPNVRPGVLTSGTDYPLHSLAFVTSGQRATARLTTRLLSLPPSTRPLLRARLFTLTLVTIWFQAPSTSQRAA